MCPCIRSFAALLDGYESVRPLSDEEAAALAPMTALCHAEFALSEADYFLGVLHSEEKARWPTTAGWWAMRAGFAARRQGCWMRCAMGRSARIESREGVQRMMNWTALRTILPRTGWRLRALSPHGWASGSPRAAAHLLARGAGADIFYLIVFYRARLFSDALLQVFFVASRCTAGGTGGAACARRARCAWFRWSVRDGLRDWPQAQSGACCLGWLMVRIGAALPHLDAALTSYSLVASWWQARKHTANWWLWIAIDGVYVGEYALQGFVADSGALSAGWWRLAVLVLGLRRLAARRGTKLADQIAA
jgi:nicotinamide mononucleotide transporter